jgi:hypothetical protein
MFVPTLRLRSLAYKTPQNITNVNKFYIKKFLIDTRNTNGYCTHAVNTPLCNTKISLTDKKYCYKSTVPPIISTGGEILLSQRCVDLTNNLSSDSLKYTKQHLEASPIPTSNIEAINNSNTSSLSNDEIAKQTNIDEASPIPTSNIEAISNSNTSIFSNAEIAKPTNSDEASSIPTSNSEAINNSNTANVSNDEIAKQTNMNEATTYIHKPNAKSIKLEDFVIAVTVAVSVMAVILCVFIWGCLLSFMLVDFLIEHPKFSLFMALVGLLTFLLMLF